MAGSINTNIGAVRATNALAKNERDMTTAMERLSTGKRINSAQDDAAGLAIASKMTSQINSLDQAVRNAGDAISLVQSADGAMIEITNMVQRMRELAIQSISDTNTASDRAALNLEFQALAAEVSRIGGNTQWNGGNILDGSIGTQGTSTFHIGANANQVITATFPTIGSVEGDFVANSSHPSSQTAATTGTAEVSGVYDHAITDAGVVALSGAFTASDGTNTISLSQTVTEGLTTVAELAAAINTAGTFGMTAAVRNDGSGDAEALVLTFDDAGVINTAPTMKTITGTGTAGVAGKYTHAITDAQVAALEGSFSASDGTNTITLSSTVLEGLATVDDLAAAINTAGTFGMTATVTVDGSDNDALVLTFDDPGVINTAPTMKTIADADGEETPLALTETTAGATAQNSQITILSLSDTYNVLQDGDTITYTIDGKAASATIQSTQAPDGTWSMTGVTQATARGVQGEASGAVELAFVDSRTLKLTGTTGFGFEVGNIQVTRGIAADIGKTDISSFATATAALSVLDGSVASVNMKRAELGATANRLEYAADNMSQVAMNARASRSRVEDADYAKETTELARTQIIQQAGTAMLAQANQSAQNVLKLLQ